MVLLFKQVDCLFGGWGRSKGTAWFDDIQLEQLSARELSPAVVIHASRNRAPMSKYIYGQFIEHLGRCIYGGIWAEMLQDRKFFFAVGAKESPWKALGPGDAVTMVRQDAFVGEHTPRVALNGEAERGISQDGLGLIAGKKYVGRIWLAGAAEAGPPDSRVGRPAGTGDDVRPVQADAGQHGSMS